MRENFMRAAEMSGPEWIPCDISISRPLWHLYRERLEYVLLKYPSIFGDYKRGGIDFDDFGIRRKGNKITDEWGCVWLFLADGLQGQVVENPLSDWTALKSYRPPDPTTMNIHPSEGTPPVPDSFNAAKKGVEEAKKAGRLAVGWCPHGFMFQRLYYLRGFKNLMIDFVMEPLELKKLIKIVLEYNMKHIHRWLDVGVDVMFFGDDLGAQDRLMVNPRIFRKHLIPAYSKIFGTVRSEGTHVRLHSDGHIMEIVEDLVKAGVSIVNLQDLVNGVTEIRKKLKGKVCVDLDIDRQKIIPFGKPKDVEKHINQVVSTLNSPDGGLMITADIYPPTPLENIEALCRALENLGAGVKL